MFRLGLRFFGEPEDRMKEMVLRTVRRRSTEWGAALTVIGRPVVAGRGAAQHSIFRSRRIYASDSLWPFGKSPFCFCGNLSGYSLLVFASAARGPKHGHAPASILVVVLGLSPGAVAGGAYWHPAPHVRQQDGSVLRGALFSHGSRTICAGQGSYRRRHRGRPPLHPA
jgi:hypothetical protein